MKMLPIGIEDFKELIDKNAYYIDKSQLIIDCINENVTFYTRPRRFGKTLNMSMLYYFYSNKEKQNAYLFDGLKVTEYPEVMKHQNQYPVIFISLKEMSNSTFQSQINQFAIIISNLLDNYHREILSSDKLLGSKEEILNQLLYQKASIDQLKVSLQTISQSLYQYYNQKVIILIDEYDVPLQAAYQNGYYDEMVDFLRSVFSSALKTNIALEKGILTGCLRISKESIFTGMNNFKVYSLLNVGNAENFGFTEMEIKQMLKDYHLSDCFDEVKKWYDGYLFGDKEIYNPWSTIMYVADQMERPNSPAISYWANTSGNHIVYNYIVESQKNERKRKQLHVEFDQLMDDIPVTKKIKPELTYREMDDINNIYSFLLLTGYLKIKEKVGYNEYKLVIPNEEVRKIYVEIFEDYFDDYQSHYNESFYQALLGGNTNEVNQILNNILSQSISYYDSQEDFYHGFFSWFIKW